MTVLADRTDARLRVAPLAALGFGSFAYVTAETLPVGLLPEIAHGLSVDEASVGLLLVTYAAVAGLTAIPFTALTLGWDRRTLLASCVGVFAVSQLLAAIAPTFAVLVVARLVAALAHGVFWSAIAPAAARLAPPGYAARATSLVFVGNSIALVAGVPLGTALGQVAGWRTAFAVLGIAGIAATIAVLRLLPRLSGQVARGVRPASRMRASLAVIRERPVAAVCVVTLVVVVGHFAAYTYIAPLSERAGGLAGLSLSALLLGFGAAGIVGNLLAGHLADRRPAFALTGGAVLLSASLVLLASTPGTVGTVIAVLAWGLAFSVVPVSLQSAILRVAPHASDAASAVYVVAFQIGIGGGAFVGERLVSGGQLGSLPLVAAVTALIAAGVVLASTRAFPRRVVG